MSPARKPTKKVSKAGKKPAKRSAPKKALRKATNTQKQNRNKELLAGDIAFYESGDKKNYGRRTKGNAEHPRGVPLYTLRPNGKGFMVSNDGSIRLTEQQYERLALNPDVIPKYTPIHKNGKIVRFRNTKTGDIVTPYYRYKIFGKTFNEIIDEETRIRSTLYVESQEQQRHARLSRHYNLAQSYQILHPDMNLNEIVRSPDFQGLVAELTTFNYKAFGINLENIEIAQSAGYNINMEDAKRELGKNTEYQAVLAALGRRKPSDNHPVGDSDPNYIKNVVEPYYAAKG